MDPEPLTATVTAPASPTTIPAKTHGVATSPNQLRDRYDLRQRGTIEVKGKGPMTTYLLLGRRDESSAKPDWNGD